MRFVYGKMDWSKADRGQENCFLLTNGLGGFSSQSMTGSNARNDQALLMACLTAPVDRFHMVTRLEEEIYTSGMGDCGKVSLSAQQYVDYTKNTDGQKYLQSFVLEDFPVWVYQVGGLQIRKTMVMKHGENTVGVQYRLKNRGREAVVLALTPYFQFVRKGEVMPLDKTFLLQRQDAAKGSVDTGKTAQDAAAKGSAGTGKTAQGAAAKAAEPAQAAGRTWGTVRAGDLAVQFTTNGTIEPIAPGYAEDLYYAHDSRDGRKAVGHAAYNHRILAEVPAGQERVCEVIYSADACYDGAAWTLPGVDAMLAAERARLAALAETAGLKDETAQQLVKAADQFVVERESTGGKSIIAGYPFFGDWGRDTMIAMTGCCISTGRFADAKNIFRTFMKYCHKGIMPNMFPEGENPPMYNTVDASLLFIGAVYEYYRKSGDLDFVRECWDVMKEVVEWYQKGTDFHIRMDEDGLISAGGGLEQVTWMDVRYEEILPTPRHGKPVEINAYWYNDLCVMAEFAALFGEDGSAWRSLAQKVKESFGAKFWNEEAQCLRDLLPAEEPELPEAEQARRRRAGNQIRCNQIWAVSQRFTMLSAEQERAVTDRVFEKLYTPRGLRSLAPEDAEFQPVYMGAWKHRDLSYHQGTVWGFPLGGYFLAVLKINHYSEEAKVEVREHLEGIEGALREGCIGQLAEIYDGADPVVSEGCFAQAWSTSELLRVYEALER